MITNILLLSGVLFAVTVMAVFLSALATAPEGLEDESGFHYRKNGSPVSRPPFVPSGVRVRAKKNDELHLPAA